MLSPLSLHHVTCISSWCIVKYINNITYTSDIKLSSHYVHLSASTSGLLPSCSPFSYPAHSVCFTYYSISCPVLLNMHSDNFLSKCFIASLPPPSLLYNPGSNFMSLLCFFFDVKKLWILCFPKSIHLFTFECIHRWGVHTTHTHALLPFFLELKGFGKLSVISGRSSVKSEQWLKPG